MSNMSYCRFENTLKDLRDCYNHMTDKGLSLTEEVARERLLLLCQTITQECLDGCYDGVTDETD